jgi:hypothetical protein
MSAYERRWPIGTKQRTAYALMLNIGTARVDTHLVTWSQVDDGVCYRRHKTGVAVDMAASDDLAKALAAIPRKHACVFVTEWGKPFTVDGFSGWMRDNIKAAGINDLTCRPHGLRKTLVGCWRMPDALPTRSWWRWVIRHWRRRRGTPRSRPQARRSTRRVEAGRTSREQSSPNHI